MLREEQRRLGRQGAVMEGRDIGSVVFPDAAAKIFLAAAPKERAARRVRERQAPTSIGSQPLSPDVAEALVTRDARDEQVNPFVPAPDAVPLDTTGKDPDEVLRQSLAIARERLEAAGE